jgi:hypothetical protein
MAANWSHQPRRAYSFACRLARKEDAQVSLQIFAAHVNFLKSENTTGVSHTFTVAETGIPLDSLRINNVTYSSFESFLLLIPSYVGGSAG